MTIADDTDATAAALQRFVSEGSCLTRPMEIDFFVSVPTKAAGFAVASKVSPLGFKTKVEQDEETSQWTCYCTKVMIPHHKEVVSIEKKLDSIAKKYGGFSDGFGSFGNAEE